MLLGSSPSTSGHGATRMWMHHLRMLIRKRCHPMGVRDRERQHWWGLNLCTVSIVVKIFRFCGLANNPHPLDFWFNPASSGFLNRILIYKLIYRYNLISQTIQIKYQRKMSIINNNILRVSLDFSTRCFPIVQYGSERMKLDLHRPILIPCLYSYQLCDLKQNYLTCQSLSLPLL